MKAREGLSSTVDGLAAEMLLHGFSHIGLSYTGRKWTCEALVKGRCVADGSGWTPQEAVDQLLERVRRHDHAGRVPVR